MEGVLILASVASNWKLSLPRRLPGGVAPAPSHLSAAEGWGAFARGPPSAAEESTLGMPAQGRDGLSLRRKGHLDPPSKAGVG